MKIAMFKCFGLLFAGCFVLGITLAHDTNNLYVKRNKRGLLAALFGKAGKSMTNEQADLIPIHGVPAQQPGVLYSHNPSLASPYTPYSIVLIPNRHSFTEGVGGTYIPVMPYSELPTTEKIKSDLEKTYLQNSIEQTENKKTENHDIDLTSKLGYLEKLNLSPADEKELKKLSKLLGVTDFEHLPPFEDVQALLGTTTSAETIKAIKEYASTPDGLELIKDYVMSYQPAKRISLGKTPYSENSTETDISSLPSSTTTSPVTDYGFYTYLKKLRSFLTFGYYGADDSAPEMKSDTTIDTTIKPVRYIESSTSKAPTGHYILPIRPLSKNVYDQYRDSPRMPISLPILYPVIPPREISNTKAAGPESSDSISNIPETDVLFSTSVYQPQNHQQIIGNEELPVPVLRDVKAVNTTPKTNIIRVLEPGVGEPQEDHVQEQITKTASDSENMKQNVEDDASLMPLATDSTLSI